MKKKKIDDSPAGKINKVLKSLGKTPDEIAETLYKKGIIGNLVNSGTCPIANVVNKESEDREGLKKDVEVYANEWFLYYLDDNECLDSHLHGYLSKELSEFIENFDSRMYPELIAK